MGEELKVLVKFNGNYITVYMIRTYVCLSETKKIY